MHKIVIIGAGNVAWHLSQSFDAFAQVCQVMSPTLEHASAICQNLRDATPIDSMDNLDLNADFYIISVSDKAIETVAKEMPRVKGIVAHTAGSVDMQALKPSSDKIGVFYPLQTFTKGVIIDITQVPIFTQGSDPETLSALDQLAIAVNCRKYDNESIQLQESRHADSEQRGCLHLAAVFACNFPNRLWGIADEMLKQEGYDLSLFLPLINATLSKAIALSPTRAQTGPAVREDEKVMNAHVNRLKGLDKDIYKLISQSIIDNKNSR